MAKKPNADCGCGGRKKLKETSPKVKTSCKKGKGNPRARPRNPFVAFRAEVQARLRAKDPTITMPEISKRAGRCWKKLTEEQKDIYRKKACGSSKCEYCPTCHRIMPK